MSKGKPSRKMASIVQSVQRRFDLGLQPVHFQDTTTRLQVAVRRDALLVALPGRPGSGVGPRRSGEPVTIELDREGTLYMLAGRIDKAVRITPDSSTGRRLQLDKPTIYLLVHPMGQPRPAQARDKRYAPACFIAVIEQARREEARAAVNPAVRAYVDRWTQRQEEPLSTLATDGVEFHMWPLVPGRMTAYDADVPYITGVGPDVVPVPDAQNQPAHHRHACHHHLYAQLLQRNDVRRRLGMQIRLSVPGIQVQALAVLHGRRTMARGLTDTRYINVGPLEVSSPNQAKPHLLTVTGKPRIANSSDPNPGQVNRSSRLYVFSLYTSWQQGDAGSACRMIMPYRWHSQAEGNTRLTPCDTPLAYRDPPVNWLDLSSRGVRLVLTLNDVERLLGHRLDDRLVDRAHNGVTSVTAGGLGLLEKEVAQLLHTLIGVDVFIDPQTMDFQLSYDTVKDTAGNTVLVGGTDTNPELFPSDVPSYISMIGRISNMQIIKEGEGDETACAVVCGVGLVYRHLCGDILGTRPDQRETLMWYQLGAKSRNPLEALLSWSERCAIEQARLNDEVALILADFRLQEHRFEPETTAGHNQQPAETATEQSQASSCEPPPALATTDHAQDEQMPAPSGRGALARTLDAVIADRREARMMARQAAREKVQDRMARSPARKRAPASSRGHDDTVPEADHGAGPGLPRGVDPLARLPGIRRLTPDERACLQEKTGQADSSDA